MTILKNYMEEIVDMMLDNIIKDLDVCKCSQCRDDIRAITLNMLPTKYVVTRQGEAYSKTNLLIQQFEVDVISSVTKSAQIVKDAPRHEG